MYLYVAIMDMHVGVEWLSHVGAKCLALLTTFQTVFPRDSDVFCVNSKWLHIPISQQLYIAGPVLLPLGCSSTIVHQAGMKEAKLAQVVRVPRGILSLSVREKRAFSNTVFRVKALFICG